MRPTALRLGALMAAGVLAIHELRYRVGYGEAADAALRANGHDYLGPATAVAGLVLAFAIAQFTHSATRPHGTDAGLAPRAVRLWLAVSAGLLAIYTGQELLEAWVATGHPPNVAGPFLEGGWLVLPLAPAIAALIALVLRGAHVVLVRAVACARRLRPRAVAGAAFVQRVFVRRGPLLARFLAGRAPPPRLST